MEVKVFDVKRYKFGEFTGEDAVEEELDKIKGRSLGANVAGVSGTMNCNSDACAVGV